MCLYQIWETHFGTMPLTGLETPCRLSQLFSSCPAPGSGSNPRPRVPFVLMSLWSPPTCDTCLFLSLVTLTLLTRSTGQLFHKLSPSLGLAGIFSCLGFVVGKEEESQRVNFSPQWSGPQGLLLMSALVTWSRWCQLAASPGKFLFLLSHLVFLVWPHASSTHWREFVDIS